jgi:hypothetical protein
MAQGDDSPRGGRQLSGLDGMFANTNMILLILFCFCCNPVAIILGIIGWIVCTDPKAKQNAMIVTIVSVVLAVLGTVSRLSIQMK